MVFATILICGLLGFILYMVVNALEIGIWWLRDQMRGEEPEVCECVPPQSWQPLGSTFVCPECARKWYSTTDMVAWCGWARAPWWKRIQMSLGWEFPGRRKEADPIREEQLTKKTRWGILRGEK